ncbi:enolase 4 isoform X3 [Archocentrus centrarchus]|uniref:enolase 4 isoform X3 n=1 Tax=Archocentrus centrarchus TaxID=63155 RepID=UPI0011EA0A66|nr:enolase 4 isoform X3 [Archocentrus centrarchus]
MSYQAFNSRLSKEERDFYEMKNAAAEFYRVNRVPQDIERALNELFLHQPGDVHGYLADYFTNLSAPPRISRLKGRKVYDARGQLSVETEVYCIVCNKEKSMSSAAVSSHLVPKESSLNWNSESQERTEHVMTAVQWINEPLNSMLKDQNPCDQSEIDHILSTFFMARFLEEKDIWNREKQELRSEPEMAHSPSPPQTKDKKIINKGKKSNIVEKQVPPAEPPEPVVRGSLAIGSVSLAVAKSGAQIQGICLYKYIAALKNQEANDAFVCESGALAVRYERPEQPLDLITEACINLELPLGTEIHLAVNCAATELMDYSKGKYEVATGVLKSPDELVDLYQTLISKYPAVVALIDPLRREDRDQWEKLSSVLGNSCSLLCDISYKSQAPPLPGVGGHILKHINETTVSDLIHMASEQQGSVVLGTTCSEPCSDSSLADIAVGLGLDYVKLGGLSGAERMTKYNRLISIEEELAQQGILVFKEKHPPPLFPASPHKHSATAEEAKSAME